MFAALLVAGVSAAPPAAVAAVAPPPAPPGPGAGASGGAPPPPLQILDYLASTGGAKRAKDELALVDRELIARGDSGERMGEALVGDTLIVQESSGQTPKRTRKRTIAAYDRVLSQAPNGPQVDHRYLLRDAQGVAFPYEFKCLPDPDASPPPPDAGVME